MKIKSYSVNGPVLPIVKQHAIWVDGGEGLYPLVYFQRPKWLKDDAKWLQIMKSIKLELPAGFEVTVSPK